MLEVAVLRHQKLSEGLLRGREKESAQPARQAQQQFGHRWCESFPADQQCVSQSALEPQHLTSSAIDVGDSRHRYFGCRGSPPCCVPIACRRCPSARSRLAPHSAARSSADSSKELPGTAVTSGMPTNRAPRRCNCWLARRWRAACRVEEDAFAGGVKPCSTA